MADNRITVTSYVADYNSIHMPLPEKALCSLKAGLCLAAVCYLFYRNLWLSLLVLVSGILYPRLKRKDMIKRRREELLLQFKDLLQSLSSSMSAGKPFEAAFSEAYKELLVIYHEPDTLILKETLLIIRKLGMNETVESAFANFANRSGLDDIVNFSYTVSVCKRAGGNMPEIIRNTAALISDKIDMSCEIEVLLAERRMEQKILASIPVILVALLSVTAAGYMQPVFGTVAGRLAMSAALVLFIIGYSISKKIMDISMGTH